MLNLMIFLFHDLLAPKKKAKIYHYQPPSLPIYAATLIMFLPANFYATFSNH